VKRSWLVVVIAGCSFDPQAGPDDNNDVVDAGPLPPDVDPAVMVACSATGADLRLCLDFEDALDPMPAKVLDGSGDNDATTTAITPTRRQQLGVDERAIRLATPARSKLEIGPSPDLDLTERLTIEMWIRHDLGPPPPSVEHWLVDRNGQYFMSITDERLLRCGFGDDRTASSNTAIRANATLWQHVACTIEPSGNDREIKVYIDGALSDCQKYSEPIVSQPGGTTIGMRHASVLPMEQFVGSLDNVHIYARALAPAEICQAAGQPAGCEDRCPSD
jgi:hypothetical protein